MNSKIRVQAEDFDQGAEYRDLASGTNAGAVVTFVGRVREFAGEDTTLWLEHYAGMTEKVLAKLVERAGARWPILNATIIHRIGELSPGDQIVFVGISSAHRHAAFAACEFIMDFLKTEAPFWKREGDQWVAAKDSDQTAADAWQTDNPSSP